MSDSEKKSWYQTLPAKLGAGVVFLVALTTLVGNVLELADKRATPAPAPTASLPVTAAVDEAIETPEVEPARAAERLELQLDRIVVRHDGTVGTTDWRFAVEADGQPLFVFSQHDLDDTGGRNVASPRDAAARLRLADGATSKITVKGWRGSRFRLPSAEPDAVGEGSLAGDGALAITVAAPESEAGEFMFQFSATRVE